MEGRKEISQPKKSMLLSLNNFDLIAKSIERLFRFISHHLSKNGLMEDRNYFTSKRIKLTLKSQ